jgi:hypothetical protein
LKTTFVQCFFVEAAYNPAVPRPGVVFALLVVVQLLAAGRAGAQQHCRSIAGGTPTLEAIDAETRLRWLDQHLASGAARARIWAWTWRAAYSGVVIVESSLAATTNNDSDRVADIVGASSAFIGVAANVILPLKIMGDQSWWAKHYARSHGDDVCSLLNTAELLFVRGAESEAFGVGPLVHVGNFLINIAGGLVIGYVDNGRWAPFLYTSIVGIAVGEIQVATQPTDVVEDLRLYRAGQLAARPNPPRLGIAMAPLMLRDGGGASVTLRW